MDWSFFGLQENPFNVTPDPAYLFMAPAHEGALSQLVYGIGERKGFLLITGEVGTGKTTICRALMQQLDPSVHRALILSSNLDRDELVRLIAADYGINEEQGGHVSGLEDINRFLMEKVAKGENAVLVIDEAQNLPDATLEELRLISNLETDRQKLVQIILVGQPELKEKLRQPHLRQLDQRIVVRYSLRPLELQETKDYIAHRISVAAQKEPPELFTPAALKAIQAASGGLPRLINALCDRALVEAAAGGVTVADLKHVKLARKALDRELPGRKGKLLTTAAAVVMAAGALIWLVAGRPLPGPVDGPPASVAVSGPAAAPTQVAARTAAGTALPAKDEQGVFRTGRAEESLNAALATLFTIWKMDYLSEEALRWRIINVSARLLQTYFQEVQIADQYGVSFASLPPDAEKVRRLGLPFLYAVSSGSGERFAVVASLEAGKAVVYDPIGGRRAESLDVLLKGAVGELQVLLRDADGGRTLKAGDRGSRVMALQEALGKAGYFTEAPNGRFGPQTRAAVEDFQKSRKLPADGKASLVTRIALDRARGLEFPSLTDKR